MWGIKNVEVVPVVVGALGSVTKKLGKWIEKLGIRVRIGLLQKTTLLGMARRCSTSNYQESVPWGSLVICYDLLPWDICQH